MDALGPSTNKPDNANKPNVAYKSYEPDVTNKLNDPSSNLSDKSSEPRLNSSSTNHTAQDPSSPTSSPAPTTSDDPSNNEPVASGNKLPKTGDTSSVAAAVMALSTLVSAAALFVRRHISKHEGTKLKHVIV